MIGMRKAKDPDAKCCECGKGIEDSLEMFDLRIGKNIICICDLCNDKILTKTLKASCSINSKVKQKRDMAVIRKRERENDKNRLQENA